MVGIISSCTPSSTPSFQNQVPVSETASPEIPESIQNALDHLSNGHLAWDGTHFGLMPQITDAETEKLVQTAEDIHALLYEKLTKPESFAVAHVILTFRAQENLLGSASEWNGLQVALRADGSVQYDTEDIPRLLEKWKD